jgi:hypothetical protein
MMIQNRISLLLVFLFAAILLVPSVHADMIVPRLTYVYFDQNGHPYNGTVNFTVTCYGYGTGQYPFITQAPGSYKPKPILKYSANYSGCGSPDYHQSYTQYTHIDWCDLEGLVNNRNFTIKNVTTVSRYDLVMHRVPREFGGVQKYYYTTPEYGSCRFFEQKTEAQWTIEILNFSKTNTMPHFTSVLQFPGRKLLYGIMPHREVTVKRSDINMNLDDYVTYLETCKVNSDPACPGWITDGLPLKTFVQYRTLNKNTTYMKEHPCDTFLLEQDPSLILPFIADFRLLDHPCIDDSTDWIPCNLTGEIYESRFTIPSGIDLGDANSETSILWPTPAGNANIHRSPVESLFCSILSRFDMSCDTV